MPGAAETTAAIALMVGIAVMPHQGATLLWEETQSVMGVPAWLLTLPGVAVVG